MELWLWRELLWMMAVLLLLHVSAYLDQYPTWSWQDLLGSVITMSALALFGFKVWDHLPRG